MKAKRGDAVAIVSITRDYVIGHGTSSRTEVELGIVTSITREGDVKAFRSINSEYPLPVARVVGFQRLLVIPTSVVATADVERVARSHHWENYPSQLKRWESVEALKTALKPYAMAVKA